MLELRHISFAAEPAATWRLDDISFTLPQGRILVITGPNGGGKSTLARLIMGIESPPAAKFFGTARTSPLLTSPAGPSGASAMPSSCPPSSRGIKIWKLLELAAGHPHGRNGMLRLPLPSGPLRAGLHCPTPTLSLSAGSWKRVKLPPCWPANPAWLSTTSPGGGDRPVEFLHAGGNLQNLRQDEKQNIVIISHQEKGILELADDIMVISQPQGSPLAAA